MQCLDFCLATTAQKAIEITDCEQAVEHLLTSLSIDLEITWHFTVCLRQLLVCAGYEWGSSD